MNKIHGTGPFTRLQRQIVGKLAQLHLGFGHLIETREPLAISLHSSSVDLEPTQNLVVLLPGIEDTHLDFEIAGFVSAAREQKFDADLIAVDAHVGYYARETMLERLRRDVIQPARSRGYANIWLAGTSLGGLGSLLYAQRHMSEVSGVFSIAPYLGTRSLIQAIEHAGGLQNWSPLSLKVPLYQIELWSWLKNIYGSNRTDSFAKQAPLFLGFGESDRFARANTLLANLLPPSQVLITSGGHDWKTWIKLWSEFIERIKPLVSEPPHR